MTTLTQTVQSATGAMDDELVKRLDKIARDPWTGELAPWITEAIMAAASARDRIEALSAENARLRALAAAPELYEALKTLVADVRDYPAWQRPCHAVDLAEAALAKADGIASRSLTDKEG